MSILVKLAKSKSNRNKDNEPRDTVGKSMLSGALAGSTLMGGGAAFLADRVNKGNFLDIYKQPIKVPKARAALMAGVPGLLIGSGVGMGEYGLRRLMD